MLTLFKKTGANWKAVHRLMIESAASAPLAVDADGYVTLPADSEQGARYSLTARGLQTGLASYFNMGTIKGVTVDDSLRGARTEMNSSDDLGNRQTTHNAPNAQFGAYGLPLQDGNMLVLTSLDRTAVLTPPPGKCILQPAADRPYGPFTAKIGLPRGAYASLKNPGLDLYGVVVPSRTSPDHHLRVVGSLGQAVPERFQPTCSSGQKPLPVEAGYSVKI